MTLHDSLMSGNVTLQGSGTLTGPPDTPLLSVKASTALLLHYHLTHTLLLTEGSSSFVKENGALLVDGLTLDGGASGRRKLIAGHIQSTPMYPTVNHL